MKTRDGKVLICELQRDAGSYLNRAISSLDYSTHPVQDAEEALRYLSSSEVEIHSVMLRVAAPNLAVLDLIREIRAIDAHVPLIVVTKSCSARDIVPAIKCGATDFLSDPFDNNELSRVLTGTFEDSAPRAKSVSRDGKALPTFRSNNPLLRQIESRAKKIGWSDAPVLIQGETGSGKEMLAKTLHANSPRALKPFVKLNCAALPSELVESELFGYERGAFTGAFERKAGIFELADGGTILLDEIGDMDVRLQAKLLQVLQDQEFRRIGGREAVKVDVRVIAATHRDLKAAIINNTFREDLYHRLNVVALCVPSLRERIEDSIPLAEFLIQKHSATNVSSPVITTDLRHAMLTYSWPGNVRELENCMRNLIIFRDPDALATELRARMASRPAMSTQLAEPRVITIEPREAAPIFEQVTKVNKQAETNAILAALNATRWNRKRAAAILKVDYKSLLYKMKRLNIDDRSVSVSGRAESLSGAGSVNSLTGTSD